MKAVISSAGVTSKAGFQAPTPSGVKRTPPNPCTSAGSRSSMTMPSPQAVPGSKVEAGAAM